MKTTVKATYSNGTLTLERPLDFAEGEPVTVTVESQPALSFAERIEITRSSAGGWKGLHDPDDFKRVIYDARREGSRVEPAP